MGKQIIEGNLVATSLQPNFNITKTSVNDCIYLHLKCWGGAVPVSLCIYNRTNSNTKRYYFNYKNQELVDYNKNKLGDVYVTDGGSSNIDVGIQTTLPYSDLEKYDFTDIVYWGDSLGSISSFIGLDFYTIMNPPAPTPASPVKKLTLTCDYEQEETDYIGLTSHGLLLYAFLHLELGEEIGDNPAELMITYTGQWQNGWHVLSCTTNTPRYSISGGTICGDVYGGNCITRMHSDPGYGQAIVNCLDQGRYEAYGVDVPEEFIWED